MVERVDNSTFLVDLRRSREAQQEADRLVKRGASTLYSFVPIKVASRIEKLQRDFLWDGGLGLGIISLRNKALLGLFSMSSFYKALSVYLASLVLNPFAPIKLMNSRAPPKVKAFS
ncbi:hypothetical protein CK203_032385 [Vitis vinifera]|uniref:Uncharacterized protein n=1 Tax=Vitis vinifera TaxID=29760 RepID=A0A438IK18_VITVI|nr:hypothetical protein CK203_032385 [Vitis vinifera]